MTEPFIGQIQIFGFNFAPRGWSFCDGTTLPIQQNTALFALLGTQYGGDGRTTFQLPNFANRVGCSQGQGPGLTDRSMGETFGSNSVTLTTQEMPSHIHGVTLYNQNTTAKKAAIPSSGNSLGSPNTNAFATGTAANAQFSPTLVLPTGNNQPHENRQPYLAMNFCIALEGIFPSFP
ncbi:tail fiber protein [Lysobacter sp. Root690]|uniref:phage tail protein n=1 Tax=Lysobacter sp. Root690 TaxID=1736588 RepID=UPI0006FEF65E|nr:tail fiber protein [Lysobacter sp. Root690]KRB07205.1 microcystin-dependent protein [Lysobacter sp. Root690]